MLVIYSSLTSSENNLGFKQEKGSGPFLSNISGDKIFREAYQRAYEPSGPFLPILDIASTPDIPKRGEPTGPFLSSLDIVNDTSSREAFRRAHDWLQDCITNHDHSEETDTSFIPLRLLDMGEIDLHRFEEPQEKHRRHRSSGDTSTLRANPALQPRLRLLDAKEKLKEPKPYVALSYCWGKDLELITTTTKENKDAHSREISFESLPKTLQDAVTVCRWLGIRYLWVDSLCIVQNDNQDWRRQAAQMRYVYSNSILTLTAHNAASCTKGFLGPQLSGLDSWQRSFTTPGHSKKLFVRPTDIPGWHSESTSLMKRGWALQECILPPRLLHFTGWEMVWECSGRHFCECGHIEGLRDESPWRSPMVKTRLGLGSLIGPRSGESKGWMDLIQEYSNRELSFGSDKLIALSGLALSLETSLEYGHDLRRVSTTERARKTGPVSIPGSLRSIYLAGLIRPYLDRQLLWYAQDRRSRTLDIAVPAHSRPSYRAPTWSWASIDTPVRYRMKGTFQSHVVVDDSGTFCVPKDEFHVTGSVVDGELLIRGILAPVQLITAERLARTNVWDVSDNWIGRASIVRARDGVCCEIACDVPREIEMRRDDPGFDCWVRGKCQISPQDTKCNKCHFEMESHPKVWCLKVATQKHYSDEWVSFLVLQRADAIKGLAWERVGMGRIQTAKGWERSDVDSRLFEGARIEKIRII